MKMLLNNRNQILENLNVQHVLLFVVLSCHQMIRIFRLTTTNSIVLDRVKSFLPQLEEANKNLEKELQSDETARDKYNIEKIEDDAQVIQMDLHCGVFEEKSNNNINNSSNNNNNDVKNIILPNGVSNPDEKNNDSISSMLVKEIVKKDDDCNTNNDNDDDDNNKL
jgi:hypothetical protein